MINRHNLVYISKEAREEALSKIENYSKEVKELVLNIDIPAIVTRQEFCEDGFVQCGITSPETYEDNRLRIGITVPLESIYRHYSPFEIFEKAVCQSKKDVLDEIVELGKMTGYDVGVYGSCAMELITGLSYLNGSSDIDIYVKKIRSDCNFNQFVEGIIKIEEKYKTKIDGEIEVKENFGVKIKELFNVQKTVLAKGIDSVEIFTKESIKKYYDCE